MIAPEHRLAVALFGAFVLWLPTLSAMLAGGVEPSTAGLRYGAAVGFVWAATRALERVVQGYAVPPDAAEDAPTEKDVVGATDEPEVSNEPAPPGRRRREDAAAAVANAPDVDVARR